MTPSITQDAINTALGSFLTTILALPADSIVVGQVNRVASPKGDYCVMWPLRRPRLATNLDTSVDDGVSGGTTQIEQSTEVVMQIDVHGPASSDNAQTISTLFRDEYAVAQFEGTGVSPLYADDPRQAPFITAAAQYEDRWTVDVHMQIDPVRSVPTQFADAIDLTVVDVDVAYPD